MNEHGTDDLWADAARGDEGARVELFRRIDALARRECVVVRVRAEALNDVVQDVVSSLLSDLESGAPPPLNLAGFVRVRCRSKNKGWKRKHGPPRSWKRILDQRPEPASCDPSEVLSEKEIAEAVNGCWELLEPELRDIVHLRYLIGDQPTKVTEIARRQQVSEVTVHNRRRRAFAMMEDCLRARGVVA